MFIPDPDLDFLPIPVPVTGSSTLVLNIILLHYGTTCVKLNEIKSAASVCVFLLNLFTSLYFVFL
jgi:hypothetical protein